MDINDHLRLSQAALQDGVLTLEGAVLADEYIGSGMPTLVVPGLRQPLLPPPLHQVRGVEPFPAQQRADLAGFTAARRLLNNASLVVRAEGAPLWACQHLLRHG